MPNLGSASEQSKPKRETPLLLWVAFLLLCLLVSSSWLLPQPPFGAVSTPEQLAAVLGTGALIALILGGRVPMSAPQLSELWRTALAGVLLIGAPFVLSDPFLLSGQARAVPDVMRVALFAAVPMGIVMTLAFQQTGTLQGGRFLAPAMAGFAGLLLVLPVQFPESMHAAQGLVLPVAAVVSVALASAWLPARLRDLSVPSAVVIVCLPNALLLLLYAGVRGFWDRGLGDRESLLTTSMLWSGSVTLLQIVLLIALTKLLAPHRLAARFFIAPLITTLEGTMLLHGQPTVRMVVGAVAAACAALYLLLADPGEQTSILALD